MKCRIVKCLNRICRIHAGCLAPCILCALLLLAALVALRLCPKRVPSCAGGSNTLLQRLSPYWDDLAALGVAPEDIVAYTLKNQDGKVTLRLTLSHGRQQRTLSITRMLDPSTSALQGHDAPHVDF